MYICKTNQLNVSVMKNFNLSEMVKSRAAEIHGLENMPKEEEMENLIFVMHELQETRDTFYSRPIIVTSGFRSKEVNDAVGGAANSRHMKGQAADVRTAEKNAGEMKLLAYALRERMTEPGSMIRKIILEEDKGCKWVHVEVVRDTDELKTMTWILNGKRVRSVDECAYDMEYEMDAMVKDWIEK